MRLELKDGRMIWIMGGRPYWCNCNPARDLTDDEMARYLPWFTEEVS